MNNLTPPAPPGQSHLIDFGISNAIVVGKSEGIAEGISQGVEKGLAAGIAAGIASGERAERERIAAALDAADITDPETRRIVMNGQRNGQ